MLDCANCGDGGLDLRFRSLLITQKKTPENGTTIYTQTEHPNEDINELLIVQFY